MYKQLINTWKDRDCDKNDATFNGNSLLSSIDTCVSRTLTNLTKNSIT